MCTRAPPPWVGWPSLSPPPSAVSVPRKHARVCDRNAPEGLQSTALIAVELVEALVADAEVVRDLVQDDAADLVAENRMVAAVQPLERAAVDRDLVRRHGPVRARARRQRNAVVQAEQRLPGW